MDKFVAEVDDDGSGLVDFTGHYSHFGEAWGGAPAWLCLCAIAALMTRCESGVSAVANHQFRAAQVGST